MFCLEPHSDARRRAARVPARGGVARPALRADRGALRGRGRPLPRRRRLLFTHGRIRKQRFVPRLGWPPWKRVYGFPATSAALGQIEALAPLGKRVARVELVDERYYHGDTCLCSFGPAAVPARVPATGAPPREPRRAARSWRAAGLSSAPTTLRSTPRTPRTRALRRVAARHAARDLGRARSRGARHRHPHPRRRRPEFLKKGGGSVKCIDRRPRELGWNPAKTGSSATVPRATGESEPWKRTSPPFGLVDALPRSPSPIFVLLASLRGRRARSSTPCSSRALGRRT
jgi:hypothetical protein